MGLDALAASGTCGPACTSAWHQHACAWRPQLQPLLASSYCLLVSSLPHCLRRNLTSPAHRVRKFVYRTTMKRRANINNYFFKHNLIFLPWRFDLYQRSSSEEVCLHLFSGSCHSSDVTWQKNGRTYGSVCNSANSFGGSLSVDTWHFTR